MNRYERRERRYRVFSFVLVVILDREDNSK
jgi:hypothetical protein